MKRTVLLVAAMAILALMLAVGPAALARDINSNACTQGDADQRSPRITQSSVVVAKAPGEPSTGCTVNTGRP